jgi:hypothetical protein
MILLAENDWEIKTTKEKGRGIFAKKDILPGTVIGDYIGKVIRTAEEDTFEKDGLYLMYYHENASLFPENVNAPGIHLLNHSCAPTCWMYTYHGHTLFFALRRIFSGEELTVSYLLSPNDDCDPCAHACRCGHSVCTGTMHQTQEHFDRWDSFNDAQAKQTKRARIRYGQLLPLLPSYIDTIPDHEIYDLFGSTTQPGLIQKDTALPAKKHLRKRIRETGKVLIFPKLNIQIIGIKNNEVITQPLK